MKKKTYYGVTIGILMVETYFRRFVGDVGNAETWPFPVQYKVVRGAKPTMMGKLQNNDLLDLFKAAAQELIDDGVAGIATTCGFLSYYQKELAEFCSVPVATSALLQVPMAQRIMSPRKKVGILTFSSDDLNSLYLNAVGIDPSTPVFGMRSGSEFCRSIHQGDPTVPYETWENDVMDAVENAFHIEPDLGALVLECTNLTPFSSTISERFDIPVFDNITLVNWLHAGLRPRAYPHR